MKNTILFAWIYCLSYIVTLGAQEQVIITDHSLTGGFGALYYQPGIVNGQVKTWVGLGGGIILERYFFAVYATSTFDQAPWLESKMLNDLSVAHGGFWVGYTLKSEDILHLYTSIRMGAGKAILHNPEPITAAEDIDDIITVVQPELGVELNITDFMRLGVSMSYPFYGGLAQIPEPSYEGLSKLRPFVTIRIGRFD